MFLVYVHVQRQAEGGHSMCMAFFSYFQTDFERLGSIICKAKNTAFNFLGLSSHVHTSLAMLLEISNMLLGRLENIPTYIIG